MKFKDFEDYLNKREAIENKISKLYDLKVDLIDFCDCFYELENILFKEIYGENGLDWFTWYTCERDKDNKDRYQATDENNKPICYDNKSLWKFLEKNYRISNEKES